jgi:vacuolar protein sorting-associated protein 8
LAAINLATSYHLNTAPGNQNGLPRNLEARRIITGNQLRELVQASVRHAFSPERLVDATHRTADNRGVDRTSLFEGLIPSCVHACLALDDLDFLYEEVFEDYDTNGIARMFLRGIEPFLLDGTVKTVPVWITQRLVAMHVEEEEFEEAEALIWHLDPESLDVDQAIGLCRQRELWDALIYVYTRALRDYVAPVVELLALVRAVQRYRLTATVTGGLTPTMEQEMEKKTMSAYKIFPYIAATLSGLTYPSQTPLPKDESNAAKAALYGFLVDGRSRIWPDGPNGKLVLTSDEEGGTEPTYPYLRLLLRFDPESMLHTLDIAFEDSYLNDDNQGVGRLIIVKILLEMLGGGSFSEGDATLVRIFVARNVPKYPQYIKMPPSLLHNVLIGLAEDQDAETREDRQLAAEYLLSAYKPRDGDDLITLFEEAGFYRILRTRFRAERQWSALLEAYLQDEEIPSSELFHHLDEVLVSSSSKKGGVPRDVALVALEALPRLLEVDIGRTAVFVDQRMPDQHHTAIHHLQGDEKRQLIYLRTLLQPSNMRSGFGDEESIPPPSKNVDADLQRLFFESLCRTDGDDVVEALQSTKENVLSYEDLLPIFKEESAHDAVIFSLRETNRDGDALEYIETACQSEGENIVSIWESSMGPKEQKLLEKILHRVERMAKMGVSLCQTPKDPSFPADKQWLRLLESEILLVQRVVDAKGQWSDESSNQIIDTLRKLTHESFDSLILHASAQGISFPQLFKELVTSTTQANKYSSNPSTELYSEFRMILTGMLDTYRYEGELLTTTLALINRDVNNTFEEWTRQLQIGWRAPRAVCGNCHRSLVASELDAQPAESVSKVTVNASGQIFHVTCPV